MIIAHLIGGLGNQMFQYAAARALSVRKDTQLLLDLSSFETYNLHQGFELNKIFNAPVETAKNTDIKNVLGWKSPRLIRRALQRSELGWLRSNNFIIEPSFEYWNGISHASENSYLMGYWQSERYFQDIESTVRNDFSFKLELSDINLELAKKIAQSNSVSLHVRRGDYVNNEKNKSIYSSCSIEYYQSAINHISQYVTEPEFFIFSDDIEWAKSNLSIPFASMYINHNQAAESYNDMRLMSLCKHNIIANSSFSWWGAWLNNNKGKLVIAPKKWFTNDNDTKDLTPSSWVLL
ncbi:alpha-1,2-fucosyltransferase [Pseudomonas sp. NFXW11]|uniref:alpha-1,2-fucosyltransferase n=1 Tax=Pseudomonas sp. NFXW11 TaxID=2819531 RepID=UPI003CE732C8